MIFTPATKSDAITIAHLHATSWKEHYRGIYSDDYLDKEIFIERTAFWKDRLENATESLFVLLAKERDKLCGFIVLSKNYDKKWGAYLDNIHVAKTVRGQGVGRQLMEKSVAWLRDQNADTQFYLWVFEANVTARAIYKKWGGYEAETCPFDLEKHGGGSTQSVRIVWTELSGFIELSK
ncbi:MAG: ribosomal protein S18 acetylase RimI-like enzyme [Paraglaciecola sp.]|jgi:ribosomal protein S18 acetylase RimI-like enzyme